MAIRSPSNPLGHDPFRNFRRAAWFAPCGGFLLLILYLYYNREEMLVSGVCSESIWRAKLFLAFGASVKTGGGETGDVALECAVRRCSPPLVKLLLAHGANPNARDPVGGYLPLYTLASTARLGAGWCDEQGVAIGEMLIAAGADVNKSHLPSGPGTALEGAESTLAVKFFLSKGADPNAHDAKKPNYPIHRIWPHPDALVALLKGGANPNAQRYDKKTALHLTSMRSPRDREEDLARYVTIALILLEHGADPSLGDEIGQTPLDFAVETDFDAMAELLRSRGGRRSDAESLPEEVRAKRAADVAEEDQALFSHPIMSLGSRPCRFDLRGEGLGLTDDGRHWGVIRGTVGLLKVRCEPPGFVHYAVLNVGAPVPLRTNMSVTYGEGEFRIPFDSVWRNARIAWYFSDKPIESLRQALRKGEARGIDYRELDVIPSMSDEAKTARRGPRR